MSAIESIRLAMRGLAANKLRAALTMLGIIIGVGAVIALLSIGEGVEAAITEEIQGIGSNLIFVVPGSLQHGGASFGAGSLASLTLDDAEAIDDPLNCPAVAAVAPVFTRNAQVIYRNQNAYASITGTTPDYAFVRNAEVTEGRFIDAQDLAASSRVAVL